VDPEYRLRFDNIRRVAERLHEDAPFELVRAPNSADTGSGPLPYSTGLGLPLSRALAKAGNGWLGLFDVVLSDDLSQRPLAFTSSLPENGAPEGDSNGAGSGRWVGLRQMIGVQGSVSEYPLCSVVWAARNSSVILSPLQAVAGY